MPTQTLNLSIRHLRTRYLAGDLTPAALLAEIHEQLHRYADNPIWIHVLSDAELEPYLGRLAGAGTWTPIFLGCALSYCAAQALVVLLVRDLGRLREV